MRLRHVFFSMFVLLSVLMASVGAYAQDVEPPDPPGRFGFDGYTSNPAAEQTVSSADLLSPSIGLGQPGLSYRYVKTFGVSESPYKADNTHFERPKALAVDSNDKVYVVDERGSRIFKFNQNGNHQWHLGIPGTHYLDEGTDVFNSPKDVSVDSGDNIWIADHDRVVQYNSSGEYQQVFPKWEDDPWRCADDNGHFCGPNGVAFGSKDSSDFMYVSDTDNQRVQVFDITGGTPVYSTTIGVTGEAGSDNDHFDQPGQIVTYGSSVLFVADRQNARIQRCGLNGTWSCDTFHGGYLGRWRQSTSICRRSGHLY